MPKIFVSYRRQDSGDVVGVTQEQYERVMGKNPSWFSASGPGKNNVAGQDTRQFPVETVSWDDAVEFCKRLSDKEGKTYRLPTEAEWEYACRVGSTATWCFGDDEQDLGGHAWFSKNSDGTTHAIGQKKPNAWGLYDMHGNVWEWCADWYAAYANSAVDDPMGPSTGAARVARGGGWSGDAGYCRAAGRYYFQPGLRAYSLGFRVSRVADREGK